MKAPAKNGTFLQDIKINKKPSYPYIPENFTSAEKKILLRFFTNWDKPVFAIHNLPQEVVGAMFSRYSRTAKTLRRLFLDEFWNSEELGISSRRGLGEANSSLERAINRTHNFYEKVFAEFGDDSVIQMGSVHIAFEFVSQILGAKAIEDQRIASAYIEKSTRYVDFGSKVNGQYLFMQPVEIMNSPLKKEFIKWNNSLFDAYTKHFPLMLEFLKNKFPLSEQNIQDIKTGQLTKYENLNDEDRSKVEAAYNRALKAKALDTIRFFLPLTTVTNLGAHFSGQAAETTINKMLSSQFEEARQLGFMAATELVKISPNFLQNINHAFGIVARNYRREVRSKMNDLGEKYKSRIKAKITDKIATIINWDKDADVKIASEILFTGCSNCVSKSEIVDWAKAIKKKEGEKWSPTLVKIIKNSVPDRKLSGRNRRQKLPRAFEHAYAEIEFYTDIGAYKDLQRNRLSSTEKQKITVSDLYIPEEYNDPMLKPLFKDYQKLAKETAALNKKVLKNRKIFEVSEYVAIMGNKVRFTVKANLRQWCFFAELRTISGGHPTYRRALQEAAKELINKIPFIKDLFVHIDWTPDYGLGRLKAEIYTQERLSRLNK